MTFSVARAAHTVTPLVDVGVFFIEGVPVLAVRSRTLFLDAGPVSFLGIAVLPDGCEDFDQWEPAKCAALDGVAFDSCAFCQRGQLVAFSFDVQPDSATHISTLLPVRSPAAIIGAIRSVVFDALDGVPFWTRSHVLDKTQEAIGVGPPLTDYDSSTAVVTILRILGVLTSLVHIRPDWIEGVDRFVHPSILQDY